MVTRQESPTKLIAEYIAEASYEDLPKDVAKSAKLYIMDSIANMIGGAQFATATNIIIDIFEGMGGKPESTIMATGHKAPCLHAVYVNSALNNMLDFDDTYLWETHPGNNVVPPALGVGEKFGVSGKDMINAVVLGYDICLRVTDAVRASPDRFEKIWGISTTQIFGAVAAAAKLLKLNAEQVAAALGHAGYNAPVPSIHKIGFLPHERPCSWLKNNAGWASLGGVLAVFLAEKGFIGNKTILDGDRGFWIMAGSDRCDFEAFTKDLGKKYLMPLTGIKAYTSCRWFQPALTVVDEILATTRIDPENISSVRVRTMPSIRVNFSEYRPADFIDAQFSLPPLIALTIAGYSLSRPDSLTEERLKDKKIQALAHKVHIEDDPEARRRFHDNRELPTTVIIEMKDGQRFEGSQAIAKGEPKLPLTRDELETKFFNLTIPVVGKEKSKRLLDAIQRLDTLANVNELTGA